MKILIVDDQEMVRELVRVTLQVTKHDIIEASNGPEALEMVRSQKPDLVLLDVMMPTGGMDGFEVCRKIKSNPDSASTIVVILSAKGQESDRDEGIEAGADRYFSKPFSPLALIDFVEKVLGDHEE